MDDESLIGTLFANRFHIEALLGTGGMGSVYLARHEVLQRQLALKVIRSEWLSDPTVIARFRREARAASRIEHSNIIRIVDFGETENGRAYLAMEYVKGPTLADAVYKEPQFSIPRTLNILDQILDALDAAHGGNVIHRDLKPINIVLTDSPRGDPDHVKILDFGMAKILDPFATGDVSVHGQLFGTPEYMSPERCMDLPADHRSDIYSLGIIAFELLTGAPPFKGKVVATLSAHLKEQPPCASEASGRNDIPNELDEMILRCLAKKPEDRYQSANDLLRDIRSIAEGPTLNRSNEQQWRDQLLETIPPGAIHEIEEPEEEPIPRAHDTLIMRRPSTEQPAISRDLQALEDLTYALRDRGLGSADLTAKLVLLLEARDHQLQARSVLQMLDNQIEELHMTARIRESRLSQVLNQLAHEAQLLGSGEHPMIEVLQKRARSAARRVQDITVDLKEQEEQIQTRAQQVKLFMIQSMESIRTRAEELRAAIRESSIDVGTDSELSRLADLALV